MRGRQKYRQSRQQAVTAFSSTCSSLGWNYISSDCQSSSSETCSSLDKMSGIRKNKIRNGIQGKVAASVSCRCRGNRPQPVSSREFVLGASDQLWFSSRLGLGPPAQPQWACRGCRAIPESCILLLCFPDPWELPRHPGAQGALRELSPPSFSSGNTRGFSQALGALETLPVQDSQLWWEQSPAWAGPPKLSSEGPQPCTGIPVPPTIPRRSCPERE